MKSVLQYVVALCRLSVKVGFDAEVKFKYNAKEYVCVFIAAYKVRTCYCGSRDMFTSVTVAGVFRPCEKKWAGLYDLALIIGGSLLVGLCAQIAIGWPVPITGQTFAVLMIGALFGSRRGGATVLLYVIEGTAGLPVFAMGQGGAAVLLGPRGGYLVGFIVAAFVAGLLAERGWDRRIGTTILAMLFGNAIIYAFGLLWLFCLRFLLSVSIGTGSILTIGLYPFIVGDILKTVLAAILLPSGWKLIGHLGSADKINHR